MNRKYIFGVILSLLALFSTADAQKAEMTVSLNEPFFDALLDSVFQNIETLEFPIGAHMRPAAEPRSGTIYATGFAGDPALGKREVCTASIRILRQMSGVRTAVRFRDGKILVPVAFSGSYSAPFVGCVDFGGVAEANLDLEFDEERQRVIGRARVLNVNLNGSGGLGGTVIARMIQSSIDKKLNPIEILSLEKISFLVPIRNSGAVKARATSARPEIGTGSVALRITYIFDKG
jgi:hypothetical protein